MSLKKKLFTVGLMLPVLALKADIIWPSDNDWNPVWVGTQYYYDDLGDQNPESVDLIGSGANSAGYWLKLENGFVNGSETDDAFMFRIRLRGAGSSGTGGQNVWQVHMDTDGNANNVEWILQLVQSGNQSGQGVILIQTAVGGSTLGEVDTGSNTASWQGSKAGFSRWNTAPGGTNAFVDLAIPWTEFSTITGVSAVEQLRVIISTSTSHANITKDAPLGATLSDQISNVLSENIPEPTVVSLMLGAGGGLILFHRLRKRAANGEGGQAS